MEIVLGEFGPADPAVCELSGAEQYNIQWNIVHTSSIVRTVQSFGVLSQDGNTMTVKNNDGDVYQLHWMTEEQCRIALGKTNIR